MTNPRKRTAAVLVILSVVFSGGVLLSGTATAQPTVEFIGNVGTFAENVAELPDGSLAVTAGDGLYRVRAGEQPTKLFDASSLGGVVAYGDKIYFNIGNDFAASFGSALSGSIRALDIATGQVEIIASNIPAPNGLAVMPDGAILYSTVLGGYEGVHKVGDDPRVLYADVPSPNGLAVGPDGVLYVGSTLAWQVFRVDPVTHRIDFFGKFAVFCDDLTVTAQGVFAASIVGIWTPGALLPVISVDLLGVTSIKTGVSGDLFITKMNGDILRLRL